MFQIKKIKNYKQPDYPTECKESIFKRAIALSLKFQGTFIRKASGILLLAALILTPACDDGYDQIDGVAPWYDGDSDDDHEINMTDGDNQDDDKEEEFPSFKCLDSNTVKFSDSGMIVDCYDRCQLKNGYEVTNDCDDISDTTIMSWCDPVAKEPCQCHYGCAPGVMHGGCIPTEIYCKDDHNVNICTTSEYFSSMSCRDYCLDNFGPEYKPCFCSETNIENICGCALTHEKGECEPPTGRCFDSNEVYECINNRTANACFENENVNVSCKEICDQNMVNYLDPGFGNPYNSVAFAWCRNNKCECIKEHKSEEENCEYADVKCNYFNTFYVCSESHQYTQMSCKDYCYWLNGTVINDNTECDLLNSYDPCGCNKIDGDLDEEQDIDEDDSETDDM